MLFVMDTDAARAALHARVLACPKDGCEGRLQPWSPARTRTVTTRPGQQVQLTPDRGRCGSCRASQTLLPAWYVPRRSCGIDMVGAAIQGHVELGHGYGRVGRVLGLPERTVRRWLGGLKHAAEAVRGITRHIVADIGADLSTSAWPTRPPRPASMQDVGRAFDDLTNAATSLARPDPPRRGISTTGLNYLDMLVAQARREANRLLRLVDPTDARTTLGVWPAINLASGGRLLTMIAPPGLLT